MAVTDFIEIDRSEDDLIEAIDKAKGIETGLKVSVGGTAGASNNYDTAIGGAIASGGQSIAIGGMSVRATGLGSIAIGTGAKAMAESAVQIGYGTNATPNSVQLYNTLLLQNGKIPLSSVDIEAGNGIRIQGNTISATGGGGGGTEYTAGNGIVIEDNEISVDDSIYYNKTQIDNGFVAKPTTLTLTDGSAVTLADNTDYTGTAITDLTFAFPNGNFECYISFTTATSGYISIVFPQTAKFIGEAPTFSTGEEWEISVKNGVVVAGKVS